MFVTSADALAAGSYQPITLLRISARAKVVVVLPALGDHSVQSVNSDGCIGSSKFQTVIVTGTVADP